MAHNSTTTNAPPERVFAVLADGHRYADWVVGTRRVRSVTEGWPAVDAAIHHSVGIGPLELRDETRVEEVDPPKRIVLIARARPFAEARIEMTITPNGAGSTISMREAPVAGAAKRLYSRVADVLLHVRNAESLRRLSRLVDHDA
jgi:uncharacterized protein YndB with AHSA1/START domain